MLIPVEWLKEFVEVPDAPEALADRLTATGNEIEEIRPSADGPVFYLKLTPNRADMLAMRGIGREIAALYERPFQEPAVHLKAEGPAAPEVRVDIEAPDLCARYVARVIRGVKVGPSPAWMQRRLEAAGMRAINNVVDVTNYVMLEQGQPLHAFDLDLLTERRIVVRRARDGESIIAIDGSEPKLTPEMLVIADAERPVAIAGVMGGQETEVSEKTTDILLESAYFDPVSVRRTSKRTGIASAASYRFERGVDPEGVLRAADRAAALIAELSGGTVSETVVDEYPLTITRKMVCFRPERARALLGLAISDEEAESYLERLDIRVNRKKSVEQRVYDFDDQFDELPENRDEGLWLVFPPTNRPDLVIEEDIIEEVGRMYGYDRLPETLPSGTSGIGKLSAFDHLQRNFRDLLTSQGLYEAVTSTLIAENFARTCQLLAPPVWPASPEANGSGIVRLKNPLSEEFNILRPSLIPGLVLAAFHNSRFGLKDIFLFEAGYANYLVQQAPRHRLMVAGLLSGSRTAKNWRSNEGADKNTSKSAEKEPVADFYTAKGAVEALAHGLNIGVLEAARAEHPALHPGRSAWLSVGGERIGVVGELHPDVAAALDLPRGVYVFELDGEALLRLSVGARQYESPSRYPRALRDLAVVVDRTVESGRIEQILREEMAEFGRGVRLFDVYTGKPLPEEKVSLAYALELGAEDRTLTDAEVDSRLDSARRRLQAECGAEFRG